MYDQTSSSPGFDASEGLLTAAEIAAAFRTSPSTVRRWAAQGQVPWLRTPGGDWRFSRRWLREQGFGRGE